MGANLVSMAYVYAHIRRGTREIFYIGISKVSDGKYTRAREKGSRNRHWNHITSNHDWCVCILDDNLSDEKCLEREKMWIAHFKRQSDGGTLCNLTDGGDGTCGSIISTETRKKFRINRLGVSPANKGKPWNAEQKMRMSILKKGHSTWNKGLKMSVEQLAKRKSYPIDKINKGESHYMFGKKVPDETRKKIAQSMLGRPCPTKGRKMPKSLDVRLRGTKKSRAVVQYDANDNVVAEYKTMGLASDATGVTTSWICSICKKERGTAHGFYWRYKNPT